MKNKYGIITVGDPLVHMDIIKSVGYDATFTQWQKDKTEAAANRAAKLGLYYQSIHAPHTKTEKLWENNIVTWL